MAEIKSFQALRYEKDVVTDFICPPYDVINPEEKERLKKLSPFNMVNVELPDSKNKINKYRNAANLMKLWQNNNVLVRVDKPALYFYEQIFEEIGIRMTRRGLFVALKLDDPNLKKSLMKPHEKTLLKPKIDRLKLLKATKANTSPIFGLFDDESRAVMDICKKIARRPPEITARDIQGTFHKLWIVVDKEIIETVKKCLSSKKIFMADGHHRYETAWNYSQERKEKDRFYNSDVEYNYILAYLCPTDDPGISIWPTHRVVEAPANLESNIEKFFDVHLAKDFQKLLKKETQPIMIFKDGKYRVLTIKKESFLKKAMPDKSKEYRNLAVSILHYLLVPDLSASNFIYVKNDKEAVFIAKKTNKIAVIVPAMPVEYLKNISLNNEVLPQKSTYFYPKLASGMVIRTL
ncbi:MAG: DUF1015 domain-containing protein [Endomicrobium sp.]|jgi:uncharacterized protein (DUF1015 family)|nr:DUF1015 domain-containing protein [Endomicrobium sp.]